MSMTVLSHLVDVMPSSAVALGDCVACDGFSKTHKLRVQTHAHDDHLKGFGSSKQTQHVIMTSETGSLLSTRKEYYGLRLACSNVHYLDPGQAFEYESHVIHLCHSNHILGGVQVCVTLPSGLKVGYSSDFDWPLDEVIQVDALVVDSTAGHPHKVLKYTQGEAEEALLNLTQDALKSGPVDILGSQRGIVQRAMNVLSPMFPETTFLCSKEMEQENEVYRHYGSIINPSIDIASDEGRRLLANGSRYIRFRGRSDKKPIGGNRKTKITLSPFPSPKEHPVTVWCSSWPEQCYTVGLYDHADFKGTLEYIRNTGAQFVLTDSRGQFSHELAAEIRAVLNVESRPALQRDCLEWGV